MITKEMRNDIMYGQNWVEQTKMERTNIEYIPIYLSCNYLPSRMMYNMLHSRYNVRLHNRALWERRRQKFMTNECNRRYYTLID